MVMKGVVAGLFLAGLSMGASAAEGLDCRSPDGCGPAHERDDANVVRRERERDEARPLPRYSTSHRFVPADVRGSERHYDLSGYPASGSPGSAPSGAGRVYRYRVRQPTDVYRRAYRPTAPRDDQKTYGHDARPNGRDLRSDAFGPTPARSAPRFDGDATYRAASEPPRRPMPRPDESAPRARPTYSTRPPAEADD